MAQTRKKTTIPSSDCTPAQCQSSFDSLDVSISKVGMLVEKIDDRMDAFGERIAKQEAHVKDMGREIKKMESNMRYAVETIRSEITEHSSMCPGREYALRKIKHASHAPPPVSANQKDTTGAFLLDTEFRRMAAKALDEKGKSFTITKWVIYIGVVVGVAIAAAIYALVKLQTS